MRCLQSLGPGDAAIRAGRHRRNPALEIVFDTLRTSRKYANLSARAACSLVIGWRGEQPSSSKAGFRAGRRGTSALSGNLFPGLAERPRAYAVAGHHLLVVRPHWIRYSDFDRRPPLIHEFTFLAVLIQRPSDGSAKPQMLLNVDVCRLSLRTLLKRQTFTQQRGIRRARK